MKVKFPDLISAMVVASLTVCAFYPNSSSAAGAASATPAKEGYLTVFTATQTVDADFHAYFDLHMGYDINDASGKEIKFVPNHDSDIDEAPDTATLPQGFYSIVARSVGGMVRFSVEIRSGETTTIRLDGTGLARPRSRYARPVVLPNGEIIGWSTPV
jgi:hypothetical protein